MLTSSTAVCALATLGAGGIMWRGIELRGQTRAPWGPLFFELGPAGVLMKDVFEVHNSPVVRVCARLSQMQRSNAEGIVLQGLAGLPLKSANLVAAPLSGSWPR